MVTSISSKTSTGGVFWRGDTKRMRQNMLLRTADAEAAGIGATGQSRWLLDEVVRFLATPGYFRVFQAERQNPWARVHRRKRQRTRGGREIRQKKEGG